MKARDLGWAFMFPDDADVLTERVHRGNYPTGRWVAIASNNQSTAVEKVPFNRYIDPITGYVNIAAYVPQTNTVYVLQFIEDDDGILQDRD